MVICTHRQGTPLRKVRDMTEKNNVTVTKRNDGFYDVSTDAGYIGAIYESQIEKAVKILERDKYGMNFYRKLNG